MNSDQDESYILLLLSDSNLPTGSFVASSGLESFVKHGFGAHGDVTSTFVQDSLDTYARSALPFVSDAHRVAGMLYLADGGDPEEELLGKVVEDLLHLDELYEATTLNHVARRASRSQGVALLTLYTKGFSRPPSLSSPESQLNQARERRMSALVNRFKLLTRREETHGHLPICWGILTAALALTLERTQYLHLFLHARSLLSASVRLNTLGPYGAQQILLHVVRSLVTAETARCKDLRTGTTFSCGLVADPDFDIITNGPATTWPLGEILAGRHDLQHSRIFNS